MYSEVVEIQRVTEMSYAEWEWELGRFSITAGGALLQVLGKSAHLPSDFATMQFNVVDLAVTPLHDDGTEFTAGEVTADVLKRVDEARGNGGGPTNATGGARAPQSPPGATALTSLSSPPGAVSAPRSSTDGSPRVAFSRSKRTRAVR